MVPSRATKWAIDIHKTVSSDMSVCTFWPDGHLKFYVPDLLGLLQGNGGNMAHAPQVTIGDVVVLLMAGA